MSAQVQQAGQPYEFWPEGSAVGVTIAGATAHLRASGALWLPEQQALIVADLHLEKGSAYAARGQLLPPYDTRETLRRLAAETLALQPRILVMLGDAFHDRHAESRLDPADVAALHALARGRALIWVLGNHDPLPPSGLPGDPMPDMDLGGLRLRHEPVQAAAFGETAGHLHPCARIKGGGRSVRRRCFVTDGDRLILPAFGSYAGGLNIRDEAFAGLFTRAPLAIALGARRAHAVAWRSTAGD